MEHFYNTLGDEDWFNYEEFYYFIINNLKNNSKMVEVGSWLGKSICYFAVESKIQNKNIECSCVDIWEPYSEIPNHELFDDDGAYKKFLSNIESVKDVVTPYRGKSVDVSKNFENEYFDFIFIDAAHDYNNVLNDLKCWFPKLKKNGIIGGHDYYFDNEVALAVNDFFKEQKIEINGPCWYVKF